MGNTNTSLVSISAKRYKKGDKESSEFLDNEVQFSYPEWENITASLEEGDHGQLEERDYSDKPDLIFTEDIICIIDVIPFGQSFDLGCSSAVEWELDYIGMDFFEGFHEQLAQIAQELFKEHDEKIETFFRDKTPSNEVQFITVWEHYSHQDYYGEWDSDWDLLGVLDLKEVSKLFKEIK